jgi:hypothetical protein
MSSVLKNDANRGGGGNHRGSEERNDVLTEKAATAASDSKYYKQTCMHDKWFLVVFLNAFILWNTKAVVYYCNL